MVIRVRTSVTASYILLVFNQCSSSIQYFSILCWEIATYIYIYIFINIILIQNLSYEILPDKSLI